MSHGYTHASLQHRLRIRWTRNPAGDVERHTRKEKGVLIQPPALFDQLASIEEFADR